LSTEIPSMMPSLQSGSVPRSRTGCRVRGLLLAWCGVITLLSTPVVAQSPPTAREELMRKWDVDRDGKVDASEAEAARSRMRRTRNEALMQSGIDPVTGRPRVHSDTVTGRPGAAGADAAERGGLASPDDDGGLILVPGNGEQPGGPGVADRTQERSPRPAQSERPALPGTRVPTTSSTIPSVAPNRPNGAASPGSRPTSLGPGSRSSASPAGTGLQGPLSRSDAGRGDAGSGELSSRARMLPGSPQSQNPSRNPGQNPEMGDPQALGSGRDRRPPGERPGIISGGVRAGGPAGRQGYGSGGPPTDLNAGRLPGGLPQTRGTAAGARGGARGVPASQQPGMGRSAIPPTPSSGMPAATRPGIQQPGLQQPDGGRRQLQPQSQPRSPGTVPRVPRMSTDDFYGR